MTTTVVQVREVRGSAQQSTVEKTMMRDGALSFI